MVRDDGMNDVTKTGNKMNKVVYIILSTAIAVLCSACTHDASDLLNPGIGTETVQEADADFDSDKAPGADSDALTAGERELTAGVNSENDNAGAPAGDDADVDILETPHCTITMVGDVLLHTPVEEAAKRDDGSYDYTHIFSETEDLISEADIALVNQEVIIGGKELGVSGYPAFNASYEIGDALAASGFDVVLHATNHVLDKGKNGLHNCINYWEENHPEVEVLGIHGSEEDKDHISVIEADGIKIAFLNYTYGTNGIAIPSDMPYAVDMLDEARVKDDLARAEGMADFTVVCPHWGTEYRLTPDSYQKKWAQIFADGGADLVLGTHPHVIEPIEWVEAGTGDDKTLVYYSLGNYVNWTSGTGSGTANRMVGGMARVDIEKDENGLVYISNYNVTALVTDLRNGTDGVTVYTLSEYTDEQADANEIRKQDPAFTREYCVELCNEVWEDQWN